MESKSLIDKIQDCDFESRVNDVVPMLEDKKLYGTVSLINQLYHCLKMALEKQMPKKPIFTDDKQFALCPSCD